jgi:hypothetical protein
MTDVPGPEAATLDRLCATSRQRYANPYEAIEWPAALDRGQWFTSPELVSLHGTRAWDAMDTAQRMRLSFWEAVGFYSLNVHGEKYLMQGLARRLYSPGSGAVDPYLHHMLDEENKHGIYFGGFCARYAGKLYPDRTVTLGTEPEGAEDFLFFARVLIFEELVDRFNVLMAGDERLAPVARRINLLHHLDETRHLAFGRGMVRRLFDEGTRAWTPATLAGIRAHLAGYLTVTWRSFYNPAVYLDAGLDDPWGLAARAWDDPATRRQRRAVSRRCLRFLTGSGILVEEPAL